MSAPLEDPSQVERETDLFGRIIDEERQVFPRREHLQRERELFCAGERYGLVNPRSIVRRSRCQMSTIG